jgi:hypothetical protein
VARLFVAGLGAVYLSAFASLACQLDGLLGSRGVAPAAALLDALAQRLGDGAWLARPTLFWLGASDAALHAGCAAGMLLALCAIAGLAPRASLAGLFALYLSFVSAGGIFLAYQWDALLLEAGALAVLVAPGTLRPRGHDWQPRPLAIWLPRALVVKLMAMSGAAKLLSGDPTWRGLDALAYHYETQPLPTWSSWLAHSLPRPVHELSTLATLAVELALPLAVFAGRRGRLFACAAFAALQLAIAATGNYGFFNLLTLVLCTTLLDDRALARLVPARLSARLARAPRADERAAPAWPRARAAAAGAATLSLLALGACAGLERLGLAPPEPAALAGLRRSLAPFQLANGYGLFAVMTTERIELEVLGSDDGKQWRPYAFRWKPGEPARVPRFAPLHMPRLDWQMWFAALGRCGDSRWLEGLFAKLLEAEPAVLALLADDPFDGRPPRFLRTDAYRYEFARSGDTAWWRRTPLGPFCPVVTLDAGRLVRARPG